MDLIFDALSDVSCVPSGAVNVRVGAAVEGPGGRWIPCASSLADSGYFPCVYQVGPGQRQVCGANTPSGSEDEALSRAIELALTASA